ncbi:uncharacterized protein Ecym_4750 [Eremothecium cymbalariae DBVPG|uniref:Suppressor of forked domain-containing protein n=1 Tax=Eremothecium cymbalariae (strain CBS 270.75 / DBVPG 7215 / KCTC 17166 / NRRL Y-17582) TaxID=931890 RepID=G8JSP3_ERECY|nr:hypothetical protein Ecym_4750 [Eremothecium cymbalariae DBVPG\
MEGIFQLLDNYFLTNNANWKESVCDVDWTNINSLERLISETEKLIVKYPNPNDKLKHAIYKVFEEVLNRFPLFFGYWKKFVSVVYQLDGLDKSLETLQKSVNAFPISLDLWNDYLGIILVKEQDISKARLSFKTAEKLVGCQFLSHTFWDLYIEFETKNEQWRNLFQIYSYLSRLPLHQYAKYYTDFKVFLKEHPDSVPTDVGDNFDVDTMFVQTQQLVNDVWKFESQITQNFFNLNPVGDEELNTWNEYLEFLLKDPRVSAELVKATFERALVPCYFYEHFWNFYVSWLLKNDNSSSVSQVFHRGIKALPADNLSFAERYVEYLKSCTKKEKERYADLYKDALVTFCKKSPKNTSLLVEYLNLVKLTDYPSSVDQCDRDILAQQNNYTKFLEQNINGYLKNFRNEDPSQLLSILNDHNIGVAVVQLIKMNWLVLKNAMQARKHFNQFSKFPQLKASTAFWLLYYKFEKVHKNFTKLNKFISELGNEIFLPTTIMNDIIIDYQQFYLINSDINEYERKLAADSQIFDPLVDSTLKINNPQWKSHMKTSKDKHKSFEYRENGHPGIFVDAPKITNTIISKSISSMRKHGTQPLPSFRNLEKINQQPKYLDVMGEYISSQALHKKGENTGY